MDLSTITVSDFKSFFYRDFPYLPVYDPAQLYNAGTRVYYPTTLLFYLCLVNGTQGVTPGTNPNDWSIISDDINNYVQDSDITKAFAEAQILLNQALFGSDTNIRIGYLYLTAHYLCNDLKAAGGGIGAATQFLLNSRTVGSVSESYSIPQAYLDNPSFAFYTNSAYGMKYLSLVLPNLVGNVVAVIGGAHP